MRSFRLLLAALALATAPHLSAEPAAPPPAAASTKLTFLQTVDGAEGSRALQTASVEYRPAKGLGPSIWLVGVAHLGTKSYYQKIQQRLDLMSVVLYEGVGLRDVKAGPGAVEGAGGVQQSLAKALGMEFQLDVIDYRRPHFINSDLHVPELKAEVEKRASGTATAPDGEPADEMMDQVMDALQGTGMAGGALNQMIGLLGSSPQMREMTKVMLVEVLSQAGEFLALAQKVSPEMKDLFDVLLRQRNEIVVRDLRTHLAKLKAGERIAVFYGAAHMDEIAETLRKEFGYAPVATQWDTAFSASPAESGINPLQIKMMLELMRAQLEAAPAATK